MKRPSFLSVSGLRFRLRALQLLRRVRRPRVRRSRKRGRIDARASRRRRRNGTLVARRRHGRARRRAAREDDLERAPRLRKGVRTSTSRDRRERHTRRVTLWRVTSASDRDDRQSATRRRAPPRVVHPLERARTCGRMSIMNQNGSAIIGARARRRESEREARERVLRSRSVTTRRDDGDRGER